VLARLTVLRLIAAGVFLCAPVPLRAQGNYEVQVYGADTMAPGKTMLEFHSNYTVQGSKFTTDGTLPTFHQFHETFEVTQGINNWFEVGFYVFTNATSQNGWQWVGDHIRPKVRAPESWHWPVGVALAAEVGYQRAIFDTGTWSLEIRPIVDKKFEKFYFAFNPTLDRAFKGPGVQAGLVFSPNAKGSYDVTRKVSVGLEYYGSFGSLRGFDAFRYQEQMFVPCVDIDFGPDWEFNFGVGIGATNATDHLLVKMIVGRRFDFPQLFHRKSG
jgi:hypothetical protein